VSGQELELVFTSAAVLGAGLLILSSAGTGMHVRVHVPLRVPHPRPSRSDNATAMPIVLGFVAMFGIGGLFANQLALATIAQVMVALAFGAVGGAVAFAIFAALGRAEGTQPTALRDLIGRRARVSGAIPAGGRGTVSLAYDGAVHTLPASAAEAVARGADVEIVNVHGLAVVVRSIPPP
jgi:membrane protein implicated in regulation of membrane protease activity